MSTTHCLLTLSRGFVTVMLSKLDAYIASCYNTDQPPGQICEILYKVIFMRTVQQVHTKPKPSLHYHKTTYQRLQNMLIYCC